MLIGSETENLSWTQKPPTRFVIETFHLNNLAVCCGYVSNLIGRRTVNIPEIILGVHGLMGFTVKAPGFRSKFRVKTCRAPGVQDTKIKALWICCFTPSSQLIRNLFSFESIKLSILERCVNHRTYILHCLLPGKCQPQLYYL